MTAFDDALRGRIRRHLDAFAVVEVANPSLRPAAVCVAVLPAPDGRAVVPVLRRGSAHGAHRGQRGLPGGTIDEGETVVQAALRELEEEIGIPPDGVEVLGRLDDYATRSGFRMSPVVAWCPDARPVIASAPEVQAVDEVPLDSLLAHEPELSDIPESDRKVLYLPLGGMGVFAPTGAILYQFREVALRGNAVRVAHLDQPVFAWR